MKISLKALKYYVDINVPVEELCDKMVMAGFEVEEIINTADTMHDVVVGKILKIEKHPDADKLKICTVDVGDGTPRQIVTGADNVFEGAIVPAALHNSLLPNGTKITKGKLRGVVSEGMMCSGGELLITDSDMPGAEVNGILIMDEKNLPGTDMREVLGLDDYIIDFKITANRPDCQSILGVAREVSVVLGTEFRPPVPEYKISGGNVKDLIKVTVEDTDICPRYMGAAVSNLRIGESPDWLKRTLKAGGMRPINNIVDITNFVMLETGQPLHAFDRRDITGGEIIVRRAKEGEKITTLDGNDHTLTSDMLVIADRDNPSCLAGVMGGLNSEIKPDTTELFLESAKFRRDSIRRTSRAVGLRTESSARYERGVDTVGTEYALKRALQLINDLDAGDIVGGMIDEKLPLPEKRVIKTTVSDITALLGVDVPKDKIVSILNSLCIETKALGEHLTCHVPSFRDDVEGRADLAEEVMRIYGYDHIKGSVMKGDIRPGRLLMDREKADKVKSVLVSSGMHEIMTYSFISSKAISVLRLPENDKRLSEIHILNPLGDEYSVMRTQLVSSMLSVLSSNIKRGNDEARLFEISRVYFPKSLPVTEQPDEIPTVCLGMYGEDEDFFTLKGAVLCLLDAFGTKYEIVRSNESWLHPGRSADIISEGQKIGSFGEVHPESAEAAGISSRVYVAEISLTELYKSSDAKTVYKPISRTPAVTRDIALLCERSLPAGEIEKAIKKAAGQLLESVKLFDVYEGDRIEKGKKSIAYSMTLRAHDKTLTDAETNETVERVIAALKEIGAELRR